MAAPERHLVLDDEAAAVLLSADPDRAKLTNVVEAVLAASRRGVIPTAVRCEADWRRSDPAAANANRLAPTDDDLGSSAADRIVELRRLVANASLVDAAVAVTAERLAAGDHVEILTSDVRVLTALAGHIDGNIDVRRL